MWAYIQNRKRSFPNIIMWWEESVKPNMKKFYIQQGKEMKRLQYGFIQYLET